MAKYNSQGWHHQTERHSSARRTGKAGGQYVTAKPVSYSMDYTNAIIPPGTKVEPATNLPKDSEIKFWAKNWKIMSENERRWARNYGFGLKKNEVKYVSGKQKTIRDLEKAEGEPIAPIKEELDKIWFKIQDENFKINELSSEFKKRASQEGYPKKEIAEYLKDW